MTFFCDNYLFCFSPTFLYFIFYWNSHGTASVLFEAVPMEYSTSVKEASTKVIVTKTVMIIKSFGCKDTVELQDPVCD